MLPEHPDFERYRLAAQKYSVAMDLLDDDLYRIASKPVPACIERVSILCVPGAWDLQCVGFKRVAWLPVWAGSAASAHAAPALWSMLEHSAVVQHGL